MAVFVHGNLRKAANHCILLDINQLNNTIKEHIILASTEMD